MINLEVLKLREVDLPNGTRGTVLDIDDLKRLCSTYKVNLNSFKRDFGLSRGLWDNTLFYYNLSSHDLFSWRKLIIVNSSLHLNSSHGFSRVMDLNIPKKDTKLQTYIKRLLPLCPNLNDLWYSKITHDPRSLSKDLSNIARDLLDCKGALKNLTGRCRKYAKKNGVNNMGSISSSLENSVANILDDLGIKYQPQFFINPYHYDFYLPDYNILLEVDGGLHNTRYDEYKEKLTKEYGYRLLRIRIDKKGIKQYNYEEYKDKVSNALRLTNSI